MHPHLWPCTTTRASLPTLWLSTDSFASSRCIVHCVWCFVQSLLLCASHAWSRAGVVVVKGETASPIVLLSAQDAAAAVGGTRSVQRQELGVRVALGVVRAKRVCVRQFCRCEAGRIVVALQPTGGVEENGDLRVQSLEPIFSINIIVSAGSRCLLREQSGALFVCGRGRPRLVS